ncbi:MAG: hypothetical protein O3C65_13810 [Proteobacteria bacterium]|nr:hypothetical protein [Pseudomonadota bacterium]MDA1059754.1 hypothetical protein [Pseudomonadota bacterium]
MERSSLYGRDDNDAFTDLLFNALLGFAFMFFIAFVLINPQADTGKIDTKAEYIITLTWPDRSPDDVDLYVEDPNGNLVWYHVKEAGLMHLDRDDRGQYRDTIIVGGQKIENLLNQETVSIRGNVAGEFVVNAFHYLANGSDPLAVTLKVEKINPKVTVVYYGTTELTRTGDEKTLVRFRTSPDGDIVDVNERPKSLVNLSRNLSSRSK